jgi:outer membrane protein assembly factor BamB
VAGLAASVGSAFAAAAHAAVATDQSVAYQLDAAHDGALAETITMPLKRLWSDALPGSVSYPLIVNGMVYVTAATSINSDTLYAIEQATGATLWSKSFSSTYPWAALAYDAGQVFVITWDGRLTAVNAGSGTTAWSVALPGQYAFSSAPTAADGLVFVGGAGDGGTVYAVTQATGGLVWSMPVANGDDSSPAVDDNGVYVTYGCGQDYDFAPITGALIWHQAGPCEGGGGRTPALADGDVFGRDGFSGDVIMSGASGASVGTFASTPAPAVSGGVLYTLSGSTLTGVGEDGAGTNLWTFTGDGNLDTAPMVVGDLVIEGSSSGNLYVLGANIGAVRWTGAVGAGIDAPDEQNVRGPLTGLSAGEHTVIVPAGSKLIAYEDAADAGGTPANTTAPIIPDRPVVGEPAGADVGVWSGLPAGYAYQWQLCDGQGQSCTAIPTADGEAYTPTAVQLGDTLEVTVSATNGSGASTAVTSAPSSPIAAIPASSSPPSIIGTAAQGQTLTAMPGIWTQSPTSYSYQWLRCVGGACWPVSGATSATYTVSADDVGSTLEVRITAANDVGQATATSPPTDTVPQVATTVTLTASALTVFVGGTDTFTATVAPAVGGGTVIFSDQNGVICGPIIVDASNATATCVAIALSAGTDTVTATYSGDGAYTGSSASASITVESTPAKTKTMPMPTPTPTTTTRNTTATPNPPRLLPAPPEVTITSTASTVFGTQTVTYQETGAVNARHCWLDRVAISCGPSSVVLHNLSAGTHRFEVLVDGNGSRSHDLVVWRIRAALATPGRLDSHVVSRRAIVTWKAVQGASFYVIAETIHGTPETTKISRTRSLRLTVAPHARVTVSVHAVTARGYPGANATITIR